MQSDENKNTKRRQSNDRKTGVEDVEEFVYLGATMTKEGGGTEDIKKRLKGLGQAILGNFSTDRVVIELTKISK